MKDLSSRRKSGTWAWLGAAAALLLAWTDPQTVQTRQRFELFVVVDITQSMNTRDMRLPGAVGRDAGGDASRLGFVRAALQRALPALPCGSRVALGVFTEYRALPLLAPLEVCAHHEELLAAIERIDGRMAWASSSEVARGVESGLQVAHQLAGQPALVFVSDGHESPPLRGGQLPPMTLPAPLAGTAAGVVLGVGGDVPVPIPKIDPLGRVLGTWEADEVMQTDPMSLGRTAGGARQSLVNSDGSALEVFQASGQEHLSSLKEPHLRALAQAAGLEYRRLRDTADVSAALNASALARPVRSAVSWRWVPALAALLLLVWPFVRDVRDTVWHSRKDVRR
jgi:mxaL protein